MLIVRSVQAEAVCTARLPLNESIDLSLDERILAGDLEVIHDFAREAIDELEQIADRAAALLCDEPEAMKRLAAVRLRQSRTGRQWHGPATSGVFDQETGATDRAGKEVRGPDQHQEHTPRATVGKRGIKSKSRKRC